MIFMLGSVGLPGTSGFVGEFLVIVGAFKYSSIVVIGAAAGIVLSAVYMLYLYKRIIFGVMNNEKLSEILDLNSREKIILIPLLLLFLASMGIYTVIPSTGLKWVNLVLVVLTIFSLYFESN